MITLESDEWFRWLERSDVEHARFSDLDSGFYLVRNERGDFFGSGLVKDGAVRSWIPKGRAVRETH